MQRKYKMRTPICFTRKTRFPRGCITSLNTLRTKKIPGQRVYYMCLSYVFIIWSSQSFRVAARSFGLKVGILYSAAAVWAFRLTFVLHTFFFVHIHCRQKKLFRCCRTGRHTHTMEKCPIMRTNTLTPAISSCTTASKP